MLCRNELKESRGEKESRGTWKSRKEGRTGAAGGVQTEATQVDPIPSDATQFTRPVPQAFALVVVSTQELARQTAGATQAGPLPQDWKEWIVSEISRISKKASRGRIENSALRWGNDARKTEGTWED